MGPLAVKVTTAHFLDEGGCWLGTATQAGQGFLLGWPPEVPSPMWPSSFSGGAAEGGGCLSPQHLNNRSWEGQKFKTILGCEASWKPVWATGDRSQKSK